MANPGKYIVAYDISDDAERVRVSDILEGYGFRVQKSVFECVLTSSMREGLRSRLETLDLASGFVCIWRLNETARRIPVGAAPESFPDEGFAYVV